MDGQLREKKRAAPAETAAVFTMPPSALPSMQVTLPPPASIGGEDPGAGFAGLPATETPTAQPALVPTLHGSIRASPLMVRQTTSWQSDIVPRTEVSSAADAASSIDASVRVDKAHIRGGEGVSEAQDFAAGTTGGLPVDQVSVPECVSDDDRGDETELIRVPKLKLLFSKWQTARRLAVEARALQEAETCRALRETKE